MAYIKDDMDQNMVALFDDLPKAVVQRMNLSTYKYISVYILYVGILYHT